MAITQVTFEELAILQRKVLETQAQVTVDEALQQIKKIHEYSKINLVN